MTDICRVHDQSFERLQSSIAEIKDMLSDGRVNFATHSMEIAAVKQDLVTIKKEIDGLRGSWNWKGALFRVGLDTAKWILVGLVYAAVWALQNGYTPS